MSRPTCKATRKDGKSCQAPALAGGYCAFHDPAKAEAFREGRAKGGHAGKLATLAAVKPWRGQPGEVEVLKTVAPVELVNLLCNVIDDTLTGEIDPRIANSVVYAAGAITKILEVEALESRLTAIEEALNVKGRGL